MRMRLAIPVVVAVAMCRHNRATSPETSICPVDQMLTPATIPAFSNDSTVLRLRPES